MQAASDTWINPITPSADFQLQTGTAGSTCPISTAAAPAQGAGGGLSMPLPPVDSMAPPSVTPASGSAQAGLQEGTLSMPMGPVERQGSLADLLFEILDDGDTDDLLLAEITKQDKSAADAGSQILLQQAQQQPPLLQQLQHRRLLERLQASKQQQQQQVSFDPFAVRDPSNATSSSLAASLAGTAGSTPWPSFTSAPGQPGPGAAALFGASGADTSAANAAAQDAGTALMQQLQLRAQGLQTSLPALKAAAGVAEGALLERQAMKKQLLQQLQQQQQQRQDQQAAGDTSMAAAAGAQGSQQQNNAGAAGAAGAGKQRQQAQPMQTEATPAADAAASDAAARAGAGTGAAGVAGTSSAATAAALLAEAGDDLNLDLDFLESMLQDSNGGEFKVMGDLARMVSLPVTGATSASPLLNYQQQQQQLRPPLQGAGAGAQCTSLAEDMNRAGLMQPPLPQMQQQQQQGTQVQNQAGTFAAVAASGGGLLSPAAAGAGALAGAGGMQPDPAMSMDSGMRSAMNHLGRLQIPSPSADLGLNSFQNPMSVDASRPGLDQGSLVGARGGLLMGNASAQNPLRQLQQQAGFGALAGSSAKPPLPASSSRSGVGPSNSVPDESNGSVELGAAEAVSDGEVEQSASGRRSSARRRSRLALAQHKRQQQKAQQPAAAAGGGVDAVGAASGVPQTPNTSQPQVVPGGMLQLLLNGNSSMGFAAASCQMQQMDKQQQQQQMLLQSYGSAPNPSFDGPLSPPMLGTAASTGHMGLPSPADSTLSADPIQSIPRKQLTAVLATLAPNALQQLLMLQQRQPALARVVLKRALQQLQHQTEMGVQHQGLESLLGGIGGMETSGQLASPTPSAAAAGAPSVFKPRQTSSKGADLPNGQSSRRNKAPLVFYRQRGSKAMTHMGGKQGTQQTQRAGSAPLMDPKQELMSPQAAAGMGMGGFDAAQLQQLDPAMAAALCAPLAPSGAAAVAGSLDGGQPGSMSSSDVASSDGAPPAPHQQQQPSSGSRKAGLGKRARQITQNDLSGAVAAATAGGSGNPLDASNGTLHTPQSSGALPFIPMQPGQLQMQLQHGLNEAMQFGMEEPPRAEHASGGLAALFGPNASTATGSTSSAGGAADAAVITQQARALVRILTKLNTQQLIQTRTMLHSVLQRSAPGLLDHMGAIERMINQLINLKQQQPMLPQQQQQQLLMQGAFGAGGGVFAAGSGGGMTMGFGLDDGLMGQQQQQQGQAQLQASMLQQQQQAQQQVQQQQQQHMMSWPNDPFVQHQLQPPQGQSEQQQQQQQLLQSQMQGQLQQQSPWGIATSLSGPQPLQWNAQQQADGSAAAAVGTAAAPAGRTGGEDDTDQTPYQLATRRQQGRRTKAKPDKQQRQQQQQQAAAAAAAAAAGLQMASSAPASLPQAAGANAMQQQQLDMMPDMQQQQQQRLQQLQQQQLQMQQQFQMQQQGMAMGVSQAMQQQQQHPMPGTGAAGDGLLLDAAQERQQEDMLLSWLQNDAIEDWPEGQDMLGVLSG